MTRASREHLTIPGMLFACKFVVLPEAEASDMYDKEVRAAMEFDRRIAATGWAHLARATLTSTIYGWMDTPLEPATGLQVVMPYPRSVDAPVPVRLIRTVMELNFSSVPPGGPAALPPFKGVPPMRRFAFRDAATGLLNAIDLPNVRRATEEELAGTADLCGVKLRHPDQARYMAAQVLLALHTLHSNGHVHRDIKPENVLAWANWPGTPAPRHMEPWCKVTDFGMLRVDDADVKTLDVGSRAYNPPELRLQAPQALLRRDGTVKSGAVYSGQKFDVFAAGCMLFALTTQRQPPGSALEGYPGRFVPAPATFIPGIPAPVDALIKRMCDASAASRCTALEALQDPFFDGVVIPYELWPPGAPEGLPHGIQRERVAPGAPAVPAAVGGAGAAPY